MKLTKLFEYYDELLLEGQYDTMLSDKYHKLRDIFVFTGGKKPRTHSVWKNNIKWAKSTLKKQDRIVWFLRWAKAHHLTTLYYNIEHASITDAWSIYSKEFNIKFNQDILKSEQNKLLQGIAKDLKKTKSTKSIDFKTMGRYILELNIIIGDLEHFLSLGIHKIDNHTFTNETPNDIRDLFLGYEEEWKDKTKRLIQYDPAKEVFLKVDSKLEWINLESSSCNIEGQAMGHCGNGGRTDSNITILSLRERVDNDWWKPHATFIYNKSDKSLGEMKGVYNKKPKKEFHKAIVKLLMDKRIKSIEGGGYLPENNFSIFDLPDSDRDKVLKHNFNLVDEYYRGRYQMIYNYKYRIDNQYDEIEKDLKVDNYRISGTGNYINALMNVNDYLVSDKSASDSANSINLSYIFDIDIDDYNLSNKQILLARLSSESLIDLIGGFESKYSDIHMMVGDDIKILGKEYLSSYGEGVIDDTYHHKLNNLTGIILRNSYHNTEYPSSEYTDNTDGTPRSITSAMVNDLRAGYGKSDYQGFVDFIKWLSSKSASKILDKADIKYRMDMDTPITMLEIVTFLHSRFMSNVKVPDVKVDIDNFNIFMDVIGDKKITPQLIVNYLDKL